MDRPADAPRHVVAIVGGATAGSAAAEIFASQGVLVIVLEQNVRPYGKIEDGLPRWHAQQRRNEFAKIDARLDRPGVIFVPRVRLGEVVDFQELAQGWGLSAVVLANGAWKDRPLQIPGVEQFLGRGLAYQNSVIYWFNHKNEKGYDGPRYQVPPGTLVIGGGLASIDVIKVVQLELYGEGLRKLGHEVTMYELEHEGIPEVCQELGIQPGVLGLANGTLFYRRRLEDMPLTPIPEGAPPEKVKKAGEVRRRLIQKAQEKFLFELRECHLPVAALSEGGQMTGVRFVRTEADASGVRPIPGSEIEQRGALTISSIGSIPEPLPGVQMRGEYYGFQDRGSAVYTPIPGVFGAGNVVTGRGNIRVSFEHGQEVAEAIVERYLGLSPRNPEASLTPSNAQDTGRRIAESVLEHLKRTELLGPEKVASILARVHALQERVGYHGSYADWIRATMPPDLE